MKMVSPFILFIFFSCSVAKNSSRQITRPSSIPLPVFDKEGHRGCRGLMPENTIPAMLKALDLGVTTLEMDAHITKDGKVIISHDPYFNHDITTRPDGSYIDERDEKNYVLYKMTYAETQLYDVGLKPHPRFPKQQKMAVHKPLLSDLVDSVEFYCQLHKLPLPFYNIETKSQAETDDIYHPAPKPFVNLLMAVIQAKGIAERVIIQSFDPRTLQILHKKYPSIKTALLIDGPDKRSFSQQLEDLGFTPTLYSPEYHRVNNSLVQECHQRNIKLVPWTVDDLPSILSLKDTGVDGIISDYPDLFNVGVRTLGAREQ